MKILIAGASALLAMSAAPAMANGGGGRGGGGPGNEQGAGAPQSFGNLARLLSVLPFNGFTDPPDFTSPDRHRGWFQGRHWGWLKPHNPHWPHETPASP